MATGQEIAIQLLPEFAKSVIARDPPKSYGHYANIIRRDPATDAIAIGPAMHAIGAICALRQLPVAPLHWVRRGDNNDHRQIFASDVLEKKYILDAGHFDTMRVVAREHHYTKEEFDGVEKAMKEVIQSAVISTWSPHFFWRIVLANKPKGEEQTYFERAMTKYNKLFSELKATKAKARKNR